MCGYGDRPNMLHGKAPHLNRCRPRYGDRSMNRSLESPSCSSSTASEDTAATGVRSIRVNCARNASACSWHNEPTTTAATTTTTTRRDASSDLDWKYSRTGGDKAYDQGGRTPRTQPCCGAGPWALGADDGAITHGVKVNTGQQTPPPFHRAATTLRCARPRRWVCPRSAGGSRGPSGAECDPGAAPWTSLGSWS